MDGRGVAKLFRKLIRKVMPKLVPKSWNIRKKQWFQRFEARKMIPKSVQNPSKIVSVRFWRQNGNMQRPGRFRDGPGTLRATRCGRLFYFFRRKMSLQGSILGPLENRKSVQNRTFEWKPALGTSKNGLREGVRKKHEILMEKWWKNDAKMDAKIHRNLLNFGICKTTFLVTRPTRKRDFTKMKSTEFNEKSMKIRSKN